MKCLQAEVPGWGQQGFTAGRVRLWVLRREQRLAGWVEGVDRLKRRNGAVQRGGSGEFKAAGKGNQVKELGYGRGGCSGGTQHADGHLLSVLTQPDS